MSHILFGIVGHLEAQCQPTFDQLAGRRSRRDLIGLHAIDFAIARVAKDDTTILVENNEPLGQAINDRGEPRLARFQVLVAEFAGRPAAQAGGNVVQFG